ncbi:MAG: hypothetical protein ACRDTA_22840 [Pseudonocardiaceae bacterium]
MRTACRIGTPHHPHEGVSELAAVGVREPFRHRGIAAALTVLLTRHSPAVGITTIP